MAAEGAADPTEPAIIAKGPFAGWTTWSNGADPYESLIGPFCFRQEGDRARCGFQPRPHHLNGGATIHGGVLMSFADFALFAIAHDALRGEKAVTVTCNSEFISAGNLDGIVEAGGEVLRATKSLVFVRGLVTQGDRTLLAFSRTLKKIAPLLRV